MKKESNIFPCKEASAKVLQWLGSRMQKRMVELGISSSILAKMTGIAASTVSDYLRGRYEPNLSKLISVSSALKMDLGLFSANGIVDWTESAEKSSSAEMVAWYKFDEGSGDVVRDLSDHGWKGIIQKERGEVRWVKGAKGGALSSSIPNPGTLGDVLWLLVSLCPLTVFRLLTGSKAMVKPPGGDFFPAGITQSSALIAFP